MGIVNFLLQNWDSVLVIMAVGAGVTVLIVKKQYAILDTIIFSLVTEAGKKYGGGLGSTKLAAVIEWLYPKIPALIRLFITAAPLEKLIERVLADAKERWEKNPNLAAYVGLDKEIIMMHKARPGSAGGGLIFFMRKNIFQKFD